MTLNEVLHSFATDDLLKVALALVALNLLFGVLAAVLNPAQRFRFKRVGDFLLDDVAGKVLPWFALYAAAKFAPGFGVDLQVVDLDLNAMQQLAWAAASLALIADLLESLGQLGIRPVSVAVESVPGLTTGEPPDSDA